MNAKSAAEMLDVFAMVTDTSGKVPAADLAGLIDRLEQGHKQASEKDPAQFFREAAEYLRSTPNPSRRELAATLRRVLADNLDLEAGVVQAAGWKEVENSKGRSWMMDGKGEMIERAHIREIQGPGIPLYELKFLPTGASYLLKDKKTYKSLKDAQKAAAAWIKSDADGASLVFKDFTKHASDDFDMAAGAGEQFKKENPDLSDEAVKKINEQHEKNKDVVKDLHKEANDANDPNVLTDFEAAFRAAKAAKTNADAGNERKAALFGLHAIQEMAKALAGITPKFADKMLAIAEKAETLRSGVVSDAARSDALPVTAGLEDYGLTAEGLEAGSGWEPPAINKSLAQAIAKKVDRHFVTDLLNEKLTGRSWEAKLKEAIGKAVAPKQMRDLVEAQPAIKAWLSGLGSSELAKIRDLLEETLNKGKAVQYHSAPDAWKSASEGYGLDITAKFPKGKPADPTENMTDEDAAEWAAMNEQHADKFKTAAEGYAHTKTAAKVNWKPGDRLTVAPVGPALQSSLPASKWLTKETVVEAMEEGGNHGLDVYDVLLDDGSEESIYGFQVVKKSKGKAKSASDDYGLTAEDDKAARFEQGKPADPTENMSPEDAAEWQANTEQYGDKFKAATYSR